MPTDVSIYGQIRQPEPLANQLLTMAGVRQADTAVSAAQLDLALRHLTAAHGAIGALAANPNTTADDALRSLGDLTSTGVIPRDQAQRYAGQVEGLRGNPEGLRNYLRSHLLSLQDAHALHVDAYGTPDVQDLGDNQLTRLVSPTSGVRNISRDAYSLKPEFKASRNATFQGGQPGTAPASSSVDRYGYPLKTPLPGAQASAGGAAPGAMAPAGFVPTAPALGEAAVREGEAGAYIRDLRDTAGTGGEVANLNQALESLTALGPEGTGPGTAGRNKIQSALNAVGLGNLPGINKAKIANFDEAAAFLNAARKAGTVSPGQGQPAGAGSPTTPGALDISQPAAVALVRAELARRRMQAAQVRSFQGPETGSGYGRHASDFANDTDPRAFVIDKMAPDERTKLMQGLGAPGTAAYERFKRSLETAHRMGFTNAGR